MKSRSINITSAVEILHRGLAGSMPMFAVGAFFPLFFPFCEIFFRFAKREPADAEQKYFLETR